MSIRHQFVIMIAISLMPSFSHSQTKSNSGQLKNHADSVSYVIGMDIGQQTKKFGTEIKSGPFTRGMDDVIKGNKPVIDSVHADSIRKDLYTKIQEKIQKEQADSAVKNASRADTFFANNKKRSGVKTTPTGLQYKVIKEGKGPKPKADDTVQIEYKGALLNGTVFDSTASGKSANFDLAHIIPGLAEGLQLMNEGSKYRFFIPSKLAYGPQGVPPVIPPNAPLIFDVDLLKIKKK